MTPTLSTGYPIDLPRLLETRMLVQASSGGGKSYALRRLLEQTAPHVQQLIIDPEGEFATLREKYDYIIASPKNGDAVANPKTAALLARRLLEAGVSAVLDIYDLRADERQRFVRLFLDSLVNAPRELWKPVMVVLDEAHIFAPQNGSAEASQAVIDVATRGRKRGQCLVLATQRLSKLHKDTAAEMLNKLIGRTVLDVDVKRAADDMGINAREALSKLRSLKPGEFFAFGPALSDDVREIKIGEVKTSHPKAGDRLLKAPPAASPTIRAKLAQLADLQKDAEEEAKTIEELRAEIVRLKREAKKPVVDEAEIGKRVHAAVSEYAKESGKIKSELHRRAEQAKAALRKIAELAGDAAQFFPANPFPTIPSPAAKHPEAFIVLSNPTMDKYIANEERKAKAHEPYEGVTDIQRGVVNNVTKYKIPRQIETKAISGDEPIDFETHISLRQETVTLRAGARRILQELAARYPAGYSKPQVGALTKFSHKGGTFNTYLSDLRRGGLIEERDGLLFASEAGVATFGDKPPAATTHEEMMAQWQRALRAGAYKMLVAVVEAGEDGLHRANLADIVNMTAAGGTFNTYLSDLRRNGLIAERGKRLVANDILFPEK